MVVWGYLVEIAVIGGHIPVGHKEALISKAHMWSSSPKTAQKRMHCVGSDMSHSQPERRKASRRNSGAVKELRRGNPVVRIHVWPHAV